MAKQDALLSHRADLSRRDSLATPPTEPNGRSAATLRPTAAIAADLSHARLSAQAACCTLLVAGRMLHVARRRLHALSHAGLGTPMIFSQSASAIGLLCNAEARSIASCRNNHAGRSAANLGLSPCPRSATVARKRKGRQSHGTAEGSQGLLRSPTWRKQPRNMHPAAKSVSTDAESNSRHITP